jgi:8-oxo-dGTP diphosphatase
MAPRRPDPAAHPAAHPGVAVDVVALTWAEDRGSPLGGVLRVAVIRSDALDPRGWALPGAYVQPDETVPQTVRRVLADKAGLEPGEPMLHLPPFSDPDRDPRRRTISLPVLATLPNRGVDLGGLNGRWADLSTAAPDIPAPDTPAPTPPVSLDGRPIRLLFDHDAIVAAACTELRRRLDADDLAVLTGLLAPAFALRELERLWNAISGRAVNTPAFRRRMTGLVRAGDPSRAWLEPTGRSGQASSGRPPKLYRWAA